MRLTLILSVVTTAILVAGCSSDPADPSHGASGGAGGSGGAGASSGAGGGGSVYNGVPNPLISVGGQQTCALVGNAAMCWGHNDRGQLGNNTTIDSSVPVGVTGLDAEVRVISSGFASTCAITFGDAVKCWGAGPVAPVADSSDHSPVPVEVPGLGAVETVSVGKHHACALLSTAGVKCWGDNANGQLGDGTTVARTNPVDVKGLESNVNAVVVGERHSCALTRNGALMCWGAGASGALGNNSTSDSLVPVEVTGLGPGGGVLGMSAGSDFTCALRGAGAPQCWGSNTHGQLGNNSTTDSLVPVDVVGIGAYAITISSGFASNCGYIPLPAAPVLRCWGSNASGQLGNNSMTDSLVPVSPAGLDANYISSVGVGHACAVNSAHAIECWGSNTWGQLGNNSTTDSLVPVAVVGL